MPRHATRTADRRGERAFTVLEVLVALSLFGVVLLTGFAAFNASYRGLVAGKELADEHQNARLVLEWITRRIRLAGIGAPPGTTAFFSEAGTSALAFVADTDADGVLEWRRYCLDAAAGAVREQVLEPAPTPLPSPGDACAGATITSQGLHALRVSLLQFSYFNGQEAATSALSQIRRVRIVLGLDSNRSGAYDAAQDVTFTMDAVLRNPLQ
ncbi:MAG: prepilin-type N-terminal cleavage/methylation domain-containing protein [Armatimonadota bacterium]|nr:prepilin-type N-terminal cleavage/methylation domain-containing protein [Armatimonadota bacterium]MDR7484990.1 prepilin-type N-terminal cleavage/methylation domain-containing protein [Armatimonadota bacterium]MDR7533709.1 prepilin-type N-terminal cleavage/methylation domain-containing protein [Armatimonadota bacterium]MDR7535504.1 prepilin-type N-terminal cleavage/methylation domain-containing protein [Armatimonadota bacterium]